MKYLIVINMIIFFCSIASCTRFGSREIQDVQKELTPDEKLRLTQLEQEYAEGKLTETEYSMHKDDLRHDEDIKL